MTVLRIQMDGKRGVCLLIQCQPWEPCAPLAGPHKPWLCEWLQFVAGLGFGSASMLRHVSSWTLSSISGFSSAFSRVLQRSLSAHSAAG